MTKTSIEWTQMTWNPTTGCDRVSPGCDHCYALTMSARLKAMGAKAYQNDGDPRTSGPGFGITTHPERLDVPLKWKEPRMVFVNSMSDLFHAKVPLDFVRRVWLTMQRTPQHTYQILTKRPDRMARFSHLLPVLDNVWLGTSVESQAQVGRLDDLIAADAVVRFISAEPLLGPLNLAYYLWPAVQSRPLPRIHWLIAGGESGPGARPCETEWLRDLQRQCHVGGVAYFLKQMGGFPNKRGHDKALLDGRLWREMPSVKLERSTK